MYEEIAANRRNSWILVALVTAVLVVLAVVALFIAAEVCRGLHVAHQRQHTHGDVSPENVLISWIGQVKVADFGLARAARTADP